MIQHRPSARHPLRGAAVVLTAVLAFTVIWTLPGPWVAAQVAPPPPLTGMLVTMAATAEDLDEHPGGGLVVQLTLTNATGDDAAGLTVSAPIPPQTRVASSWFGADESTLLPGTVQGANLLWTDVSLETGERLGPFSYRLVPGPGANGATVFRAARIVPEVTWTLPARGQASTGALRMNGLWGEGGLRRTLLPTGLTVFTRERPDSLTASIRIAVRAGSRDEDDTTSGGSHWLEHAYFLGTVERPDDEIDNDISVVGGIDNASTSWEHTDYWKLVPAEHFDLALEVLADQMLNSTFLEEAFDRERFVVFEELKLRNDSPSTRAFDEFINLVFRESPLRRHPAGTIDSVQSIPISTILAHRDRLYRAGNMAIAASGRIRHDDAVAKIEQAFAGLPRGTEAARPAVAEPPRTSIARVEVGTGERTAEIRLGWPVPGDAHADSPALFFVDDLLDATGRRLSEEIRDRRALASSVGSGYINFSDAGAFVLTATTRPDRVDEVVNLLLAEIQRIRDGDVSDADLRVSLRAYAGRQAVSSESNQEQTERATIEVSGILDSFLEYEARLQAVNAADVQRVAQTYLGLDNYVLVIIRS